MNDSKNPYEPAQTPNPQNSAKHSSLGSVMTGAGIGMLGWPLLLVLEKFGLQLPFFPPTYFAIAGAVTGLLLVRALPCLLGLWLGYVVIAIPWMAFDPLFPINAVIASIVVLCSLLGTAFAVLVRGQD